MSDFADATGFDAPDESRWRAIAEKSLKGAPFDKLTGKTADGLALKPLYRESDIATADDPEGQPGAAPFVRGAAAARDAALPWQIRQAFAHPDPVQTNSEILADLDRGVSSIELQIDPDGFNGVAIGSAADFDRTLAGVHVDLAAVSLDAGAYGLWAAELLRARLKGLAAAQTAFNIDPICALMRTGAMGRDDIAAAARFAASLRETLPIATALRVDARPVHEAGGTEAQELAAALAAGVAYLRALGEAGVSIDEAGATLLFTLSIGADVLIEAAKLRALRLCWARVMEASGAKPEARAARTHAVTSRRMLTKRDPWSNILRATASCFASAVGGAEAITVLPLTDALGLPAGFARRVARNTQITLMEESHIGAVIDPAGGAWFVEKLTRDLAEAAWTKFQAIEAEGGIVAALASSALQKEIAAARDAKAKAYATRRDAITGVSDFPLLEERVPETLGFDFAARVVAQLNAEAPAPKADIKGAALAPIRWAAPFEALRDKAERVSPRRGIFFANLGPLAEFSARSNFARNLFAAGGVEAIEPEAVYDHLPALCAAWAASGAPAAVLCGTDKRYGDEAAETASALKAAGCAHVILAGRPADEAALRAGGVDQFIFAGQSALDALAEIHGALGLPA